MDTEKDYYSLLGVVPSIDDVALAAVYRALLKKYHPDVFSGPKAEAEGRTKEIIEAYEVLGNADKRRAYNNARKNNGFGGYRQEERRGKEYHSLRLWIIATVAWCAVIVVLNWNKMETAATSETVHVKFSDTETWDHPVTWGVERIQADLGPPLFVLALGFFLIWAVGGFRRASKP